MPEAKKQTQANHETLKLKIRPCQEDSQFANLCYQSFLSTYPYNYKNNYASSTQEQQFEVLCLENEYLKATIAPSLGARVFSLFDKIANKHVFNMPSGVFPSPIYLRGTYFPIGLELNFPHGHSIHSADNVPCEFTTWDSHPAILMRVFNAATRIHTDILFSLRQGERLLRMQLRFKNLLPIRNGFMYWANSSIENSPELTFICKSPMCHFFDKYENFPIINGKDYRISKNRQFASDLFAIGAEEDWFGFYVPEKKHGCMHISPLSHMQGKKAFTWGFDDYAFRWADHFGCSNYGYVEIQAGITETQFEHLHLEPYEEKVIDETWFPYNDIAKVSFADEYCILSETRDVLNVTSARELKNIQYSITCNNKTINTSIPHLLPGEIKQIKIPDDFNPNEYKVTLTNKDGSILTEADIKPTEPATESMIKQKQNWLDLEPVDNNSTLEIAFRLYKNRRFDEAKHLVEKLIYTDLAIEANHLLAEIYYIKDDIKSSRYHAQLAENCCDVLLESLHGNSAPSLEIRSGNLDEFEQRSNIDCLVSSGKIGEARHISTKWLSGNKLQSACFYYVMAYIENTFVKNSEKTSDYLTQAKKLPLEYTNPFTKTERKALEYAISVDNSNTSALYLLGNYWANLDTSKATKFWQDAIKSDQNNYLAIRNLALTTMRDRTNLDLAVKLYEQAISIKHNSPDLIVEYLTALRLTEQPTKALYFLTNLPPSIASDYRIIKAKIIVLRDNYRFKDVLQLILTSKNLYFWEGEHDAHRCYLETLMAMGNQAIEHNDFENAHKYFNDMLYYPEQLIRGKSHDENQSAAYYHIGLTFEKTGKMEKATEYYQMAVDQPFPNIHHAVSYRENEYYAAKAAQKIGDKVNFERIVARLIDVYDEEFVAAGTEFLPTMPLYPNHLAAARGFILLGKYDKAQKCLENLKNVYGVCWPYEQAKAELAISSEM